MRFFKLLMVGALMVAMAAPAFAGKQTRARKRDGSCVDPYSGTCQPQQKRQGSQGGQGQCDQTQRRNGGCQK